MKSNRAHPTRWRSPREQARIIIRSGIGNEPIERQIARRCPRASAAAIRDAARWALAQEGHRIEKRDITHRDWTQSADGTPRHPRG